MPTKIIRLFEESHNLETRAGIFLGRNYVTNSSAVALDYRGYLRGEYIPKMTAFGFNAPFRYLAETKKGYKRAPDAESYLEEIMEVLDMAKVLSKARFVDPARREDKHFNLRSYDMMYRTRPLRLSLYEKNYKIDPAFAVNGRD